jgi:hypothetical protein
MVKTGSLTSSQPRHPQQSVRLWHVYRRHLRLTPSVQLIWIWHTLRLATQTVSDIVIIAYPIMLIHLQLILPRETLPSWYTILLIITHILLLQIYTVTPYPLVQLRLLMMGECSARNMYSKKTKKINSICCILLEFYSLIILQVVENIKIHLTLTKSGKLSP